MTPRLPGTRPQRAELLRWLAVALVAVPTITAYAFLAEALLETFAR